MNLPKRIQSIDVLRAITMFLMIFVNDVSGVSDIPKWIEHTEAAYDGMGFSDVIFPAFLFIVGLSLPFALQARIKRGDWFISIIGYIVLRAAALIIMGFFHVNMESYNSEAAVLSYPIFMILLTIGFFLIWLDYPERTSKTLKNSLIVLGIVIVATLAYLYKGGTNEHPKGLTPEWWGILGIIGWAYLFSALVYDATRGKLTLLIVAFVVFAAINVTSHMDLLHANLWMIGDASSITLMLGGAVIATTYSKLIGKGSDQKLWFVLAVSGLAAILFGFMIRPHAGGISKIYATPAWVFICMGITILVFELLVYLIDIQQKKHWFNFIKAAGTSTLTCYLIPYILYSVFSLVHFEFPDFLNHGIGGMLRSFFIALLVIRIVALLEKKNIRLKV